MDSGVVRDLENLSIEAHAALNRLDAAIGEIRLREQGIAEIGTRSAIPALPIPDLGNHSVRHDRLQVVPA